MSAIDSMVKTLLRAMDIDPVEVEKMVTGRVKIFEDNLDLLNNTLIKQEHRLTDLEANIKALLEFHGLEYKVTAKKEAANGSANPIRNDAAALPKPATITQ